MCNDNAFHIRILTIGLVLHSITALSRASRASRCNFLPCQFCSHPLCTTIGPKRAVQIRQLFVFTAVTFLLVTNELWPTIVRVGRPALIYFHFENPPSFYSFLVEPLSARRRVG
jgi:hypothetical protein